ncbi:hypothetical protein BDR05DRAFT_969968 [Suillus weaverae]|nr:hypothetical protein BDR05DRAFT_969968 [Suillus weaverae]
MHQLRSVREQLYSTASSSGQSLILPTHPPLDTQIHRTSTPLMNKPTHPHPQEDTTFAHGSHHSGPCLCRTNSTSSRQLANMGLIQLVPARPTPVANSSISSCLPASSDDHPWPGIWTTCLPAASAVVA